MLNTPRWLSGQNPMYVVVVLSGRSVAADIVMNRRYIAFNDWVTYSSFTVAL